MGSTETREQGLNELADADRHHNGSGEHTVRAPRVAVDLFSGTGDATRPFAEAGWKVITVDKNPDANAMLAMDVVQIPFTAWGPVDFVWASPPCEEFSDARPGSATRRPSLVLVCATLCAIRDLRPKFWILENVRGAIPFLGIPVQKIGPFCLWGYFPPIYAGLTAVLHRKSNTRSPRERARIPRPLARAVFAAVTRYLEYPRLLDLRELRPHRHVRVADRRVRPLPLP